MPRTKTVKNVVPNFYLKERADCNRILELLLSDYDVPSEAYPVLIGLLPHRDLGKPIRYQVKDDQPNGRRYATGDTSIQFLRNDIRAFICQDSFVDIDIVNCYPRILQELCFKHSIDCQYLADYNLNRNQYLTSNPNWKHSVRAVIHGQKKSDLPIEFHNELRATVTDLLEAMKINDEREGRAISKVLGEVEWELVSKIKNILEGKQIEVSAYCFDGLVAHKSAQTMMGNILEEIYPYQVKIKPWDAPTVKPKHSITSFNWESKYSISSINDMDGMKFSTMGELDKQMIPVILESLRLVVCNILLKIDSTSYLVTKFLPQWAKNWSVEAGGNTLSINNIYGRYSRLINVNSINPFPSTGDREFSTWRGFGFKSVDQVDESLLEPILYHIRVVLCKKNDELFNHFISWLAHLVQRPGIPSEVLYLFAGWGGTGKSTIGRLISKVLGDWNVCMLRDTETLTRNFNSQLEGNILIWLGELRSAKDKDWAVEINRVKDLIDARHLMIERKGLEPYRVQSSVNIIGFSNSLNCMPMVDGMTRRTVMTETSDIHREDTKYFEKFDEITSDLNVINHFGTYLSNYQIGNLRHLPSTDLKNEAIFKWKCPYEKLLAIAWVSNECDPTYHNTFELVELAKRYKLDKIVKDHSAGRVGHEVKRYLGSQHSTKRKYHVRPTSCFKPTDLFCKQAREYMNEVNEDEDEWGGGL